MIIPTVIGANSSCITTPLAKTQPSCNLLVFQLTSTKLKRVCGLVGVYSQRYPVQSLVVARYRGSPAARRFAIRLTSKQFPASVGATMYCQLLPPPIVRTSLDAKILFSHPRREMIFPYVPAVEFKYHRLRKPGY